MILLSEFIEWLACLTEVGLMFWLFWEAFKEQRKMPAYTGIISM